ncbi:MAG: TetR/AcrR family transcriptional regulator [Desulfobacteraceae bacterium]|nr:TetR/AcrR family transcriptional regulator [Desulfobacteraceae bacterium]
MEKKELCKAARLLFLKNGYKNTTIQEITQNASLSTETFYLYFKNKEELYGLLTIEFLEYMKIEIMKVSREKTLSPEKKLSDLRRLFFKIYRSDKRILINLIPSRSTDTLKGMTPEIARQIKDLSSECFNILITTIQEGMENKIFHKQNPIVIADILWGIFSALILLAENERMLNNRKDFVKSTLETAMETVYRGINPVAG